METCLFEQLNAVVDNNTLPEMNYLSVNIINQMETSNPVLMSVRMNAAGIAKVYAPCYFTDSTGESNLGTTKELAYWNNNIYIKVPNSLGSSVTVKIGNKYSILQLSVDNNHCLDISPESAVYLNINDECINIAGPQWCNFDFGNKLGLLQSFPLAKETLLATYNSNYEDAIKKASSYPFKNVFLRYYSKVPILLFANYLNLQKLSSYYTGYITGTIESFVAAQRANGRLNATNLDLYLYPSSIGQDALSYNGTPLTNGHYSLSWTEDSITLNS